MEEKHENSPRATTFITESKNPPKGWDMLIETLLLFMEITCVIICSMIGFFLPKKRKDLKGEIVLITGSAGYVGRHLALKIAKKGATVVLWDINKKGNELVANEVKKDGGMAYAYHCNLADKKEIEKISAKVMEEVGDPTILINNAGAVGGKNFLDLPDEKMELTMNVNIMAHFWIVKQFLPSMVRKNHGHITAIASMAGLMGVAGLTEYCASKFAVVGFMQSLAKEIRLAGYDGVHFTTVNPSTIDTEMFHGFSYRFFAPGLEVLKPEWVAQRTIDAIETNQVQMNLPRSSYIFPILATIIPVEVGYRIEKFFGIDHSMKNFIGRKKCE